MIFFVDSIVEDATENISTIRHTWNRLTDWLTDCPFFDEDEKTREKGEKKNRRPTKPTSNWLFLFLTFYFLDVVECVKDGHRDPHRHIDTQTHTVDMDTRMSSFGTFEWLCVVCYVLLRAAAALPHVKNNQENPTHHKDSTVTTWTIFYRSIDHSSLLYHLLYHLLLTIDVCSLAVWLVFSSIFLSIFSSIATGLRLRMNNWVGCHYEIDEPLGQPHNHVAIRLHVLYFVKVNACL